MSNSDRAGNGMDRRGDGLDNSSWGLSIDNSVESMDIIGGVSNLFRIAFMNFQLSIPHFCKNTNHFLTVRTEPSGSTREYCPLTTSPSRDSVADF